MDLIYCAGKNARFAQIAIEAGFLYGAQLPCLTYGFDLYFADQDWRNPDREAYMAALAEHRPHIASVIDWEKPEQLPEVLAWAEDAAQFVEVVLVIPKVHGGVAQLPRRIGGKEVRLGYSVPTRHGGTEVFAGEFSGWPVHLLGGSPGQQMRLARYMDTHSADGNMMMKVATRYCKYWQPGKRPHANDWQPVWPKRDDAPYEAFRRSCANIMAAWRQI